MRETFHRTVFAQVFRQARVNIVDSYQIPWNVASDQVLHLSSNIQLMHSFEVNIRICQPLKVMFESWQILMLISVECINFVIWLFLAVWQQCQKWCFLAIARLFVIWLLLAVWQQWQKWCWPVLDLNQAVCYMTIFSCLTAVTKVMLTSPWP